MRAAGVRAYDATGAYAGIAIADEQVLRRLTDLDLERIPTAGPFAHVTALFRRDADGWIRVYVQQELGHYAAEAVLDAIAGLGGRMATQRDLLPEAHVALAVRAQAPVRGRDRRGRLARARDGLLPREAARDNGRRDPREVVHRLGRLRAEHDDHPLELPNARGRGLLRRERAAVRGPLGKLDFNLMFSQHGHLTLAHSDRAMITMQERAEVNQLLGIKSSVDRTASIAELCPELDLSQRPSYPIVGALYHPPGGIIRHDAVVWGFARAADSRGVEIHQNTEVVGFERSGDRITAVETSRGRVECGQVVSATAGWSSLVGGWSGCGSRSRRTSCRRSSPSP